MKRKVMLTLIFSLTVLNVLVVNVAAVMKGLSTAQLTEKADAVIMGDVVKTETKWTQDGKSIVTRSTVKVTDIVKGRVLNNEVVVETPGGEIGDLGMKVSDTVAPKEGEKVLLFATEEDFRPEGAIRHIIGNAQGKYTIDKDGIARKEGFALISGDEKIDNNLPVQELIQKIKQK